MKGEARAKELWTERMRSEFERVSPRRSGGKDCVKDRKSCSCGPMSRRLVELSRTERRACVPHAFWMV